MAKTQERALGVVTIGQSPRDDVMPHLTPFLPPGLAVRQVGALDGLDREQILDLAPGPDDYVLHTRLRDGGWATIGRAPILPRVQACIQGLEAAGASPILLLCTGEFPELTASGPLIEPDRLLVNVVRGLGVRRLGVMAPLASQIGALTHKWAELDARVTYAAGSPYVPGDEVTPAARALAGKALEVVVMDCMGYTAAHKQIVGQVTGRPVMLASSTVARVVGELLA